MPIFQIPQEQAKRLEAELRREFESYRLALAFFKFLPLEDQRSHTARGRQLLEDVLRLVQEAAQGIEDRFEERGMLLEQRVQATLDLFRTGAKDCASGVLPLED